MCKKIESAYSNLSKSNIEKLTQPFLLSAISVWRWKSQSQVRQLWWRIDATPGSNNVINDNPR